eukprot:gene32150-38889_t
MYRTWAWGNKFLWSYDAGQDGELRETYDFLLQNRVNWFDTADSYGTGKFKGRSETLLGNFYAQNEIKKAISAPPISISRFFSDRKDAEAYFCTKIAPFPWVVGSSAIRGNVEASYTRLGKKMDVLQFHWPPTWQWQEDNYVEVFHAFVLENKATQLGFSNFGTKAIRRVLKKISALNVEREVNVGSNQVQFSMLSLAPLRGDLAEVCAAASIQLIGYSPLALGLLADKYTINNLPSGARAVLFREYLPSIQGLLNELRSIARYRNKTVSQVVLNWNLSKGILPLVGIRSIRQAKENLGALGWSLSADEIEAIDLAASRNKKALPQNFNQSD